MLVISEFAMAWGSYYGGYRRRYRRRYYPRRMYSGGRSRYRAPARRRAAPRRKTTTRKSRKCECPVSPQLDSGQKWLLAQVDPFEPKVAGAKIPDANSVPSIGYPMNELSAPASTLVGEVQCVALLPAVTNSIITATSGAGAWTWAINWGGATNWTERASVVQGIELTRPVAHGVRVSCPNAPTTTTGFLHIAVAFESFNNVSTWPWPTTVAGLSAYQFYKRVTLASLTQSPITVINKFIDDSAFRYTTSDRADHPGAAATPDLQFQFQTPYSWGAILIAFEGAATTTPISIESVLHQEGIPKNSSFLHGSVAARFDPSLLTATQNMIAQTDVTHTEDQQDSYVSQALNAAASGAQQELGRARDASLAAIENLGRWATGAAMRMAVGAVAARVGGRGIAGVNDAPNRLALTR